VPTARGLDTAIRVALGHPTQEATP